ncbi:MAG: phospholipase [Actinomycetota bacterium]|nr:phospholipase [Actinomycetota bacterium]
MTEADQLGPSYDGTVMLDIGGEIGALIITTTPALHLAEIEVSPVGDDHPHRTHVAVRERRGPSGTRYAAIYPQLHEGVYTVYDVDGRPADTVSVNGGEVTQIDWR